MKSSFNAFGQTKKVYGATSTPVWLGVVGPVPVGGTLASEFVKKGAFIPAGTPVNLTDKVITPFVSFEVKSIEAGAENDVVTVAPSIDGIAVEAGDNVVKVGAKFSSTSAAVAIVAAADNTITVAHGALKVGDVVAEANGAGSGKAVKVAPNHYLYNDINLGDIEEEASATGACVRFHADGILIDRTPAAAVAEACAEAIPGVLQVKG